LNELGIPTISHVFSNLQSLIASIKNRIYCLTTVAHIATIYYLAADMARCGEIELSYVPTAKMLADFFSKPLLRPSFFEQCAAMGMIGISVGKGLGNGLGTVGNGGGNGIGIEIINGIGNGLGNGHRNGIGTGYGIGNAVGM
jgi:hypothetical protein